MKNVFAFTLLLPLIGRGGNDNNGEKSFTDCIIDEHNVNLTHEEACMLTQKQLDTYSVSNDVAEPGFVVCEDGDFELNGNTYPSGMIFGQTFYGLVINCVLSSNQ